MVSDMERESGRWWIGVAALVGAALLIPGAPAQGAGETITTIPIAAAARPEGIAVGPDGTAFSVNMSADTVSRIPAGALAPAENLPTGGNQPYSAAVNSAGTLFVTNRSSHTIARIRPGVFALPHLYDVGQQPWGVTVAPDDTVFATTWAGDTVVRIDPGSDSVNDTIALRAGSEPKDITYSSRDGLLYVAASGLEALVRINPATRSTEYLPLPAGAEPRGVAVAVDGSVYVTDIGLEAVHWFRPGGSAVAKTTSFPSPTFPADVAADPDGTALVALYEQGQLARFRDGDQIDTIDLGADTGPDRVAVTPEGLAYTANSRNDTVSRVDPGPRPGPAPTPSPDLGQVTTLAAVKVHRRTAVLRARVTTGPQEQSAQFRVARNAALTKRTRVIPARNIGGSITRTLRKPVTGLKHGRTYWFRAETTAGADQANGVVRRFRTR